MKRILYITPLIIVSLMSCNNNNDSLLCKCTFISDFCSLNHESVYQKGTEANLTLKVKDEATYTIPENIEVIIGDRVANNSEYTYTITNNYEANIKITFNDDVFFRVMRESSENIYRIDKEHYDQAMALLNLEYVQREYEYTLYSNFFLQNIYLKDEVSPNKSHIETSYTTITKNYSQQNYSDCYVEFDNTNYFKYTYQEDTKTYVKESAEESDLLKSSNLSPNALLELGNITYDTIKDHFDSKRLSYYFDHLVHYEKDDKDYLYTVTITFMNNQVFYISYEFDDGSTGELGAMNLTYLPVDISLPTI